MDYHYNNLPPPAPTKKLKKTTKNKGGGGVKLSTDPQSIAARERRHRISDRFKILQSLVPNGHKMDTVSMLEEAIHYVKFLKTQIWLHETMFYLNSQTNDHHHHHHHQPLLSSTNTVSSQLGSFFYSTKPSSPLLGDVQVQPLYWPMEGVSPVNSENQVVETVSFDNIYDVCM